MKRSVQSISTFALSFLFTAPTALAASWNKLPSWKPGINGPSSREHSLIFIAPNKPDDLILYGGLDYSSPQNSLNDLWVMNLKTGSWRQLNQKGNSPKAGARLAIDEKSKTILVTGGDSGETPSSNAYTFSYEKNVGVWKTVQVASSVPRSFHALVSVTGTPYFLAFAGITSDGGGPALNNLTTLIELQNTGAQKILNEGVFEAQSAPAERYGFPYAFDRRHNRLIVSVGQGNMGLDANGALVSQQDDKTFALSLNDKPENTAWKELTNATLSPRRNPCSALDTERNHLYVLGGTADGSNAIDELSKLDLNEENPTWKKVEFAKGVTTPEARASCVAVYDKHRDRILFGFGNNIKNLTTDMWALQLK